MAVISKNEVVTGTDTLVRWWLKQRLDKLRGLSHDTLAINPFLVPALWGLHSCSNMADLAELMIADHLMGGHATGFGKLVDEKLLPKVFGTTKMTPAFRKQNPVFDDPMFSEIDHLLKVGTPQLVLLSVKASRWTIQLTMAERINAAFKKMLELRDAGQLRFEKIVVGVIYGTPKGLTDKFDIIQGVCSGARHEVTNIRPHTDIQTGRAFWGWVNGGELATQDWILEGVCDAVYNSPDLLEASKLLEDYTRQFASLLEKHRNSDGRPDWFGLLRAING